MICADTSIQMPRIGSANIRRLVRPSIDGTTRLTIAAP
jgi:hypothetical protein